LNTTSKTASSGALTAATVMAGGVGEGSKDNVE
jgi:hypothetical protein